MPMTFVARTYISGGKLKLKIPDFFGNKKINTSQRALYLKRFL